MRGDKLVDLLFLLMPIPDKKCICLKILRKHLPEMKNQKYRADKIYNETAANQSFYPTFQENHQSDFLETESSSNCFLRCSSIFNTFRCSEADSPRIRAKIFDLRQSHSEIQDRDSAVSILAWLPFNVFL